MFRNSKVTKELKTSKILLTWDTWDGFSVDYRGQSPLRDPPSFLRRLREL